MIADNVRSKLALAPETPGVYLFRDDSGRVVYVGKAASLRSRVRSYFGSKSGLSTKVLRLVEVVADIEYILTGNEQEALVLEADLIKRYRPQYNARLKDDKSFLFLKVDVESEWPRVSTTRKRDAGGALYFGPFASARSVHQTVQLIRRVFPLRICSGPVPTNRPRACLNKDIGLCPGPCVGAVSREEYRRTVDRVVLFLRGKRGEVLDSLNEEMKLAAQQLNFERAAALRDQVQAVEQVTVHHVGVTALRGDQDILAVAQHEDMALVDVFSVRDARALGRQTFPIVGAADLSPAEVLRSFVLDYYARATNLPPRVLLQHPVADARIISGWLSERRGAPVRLVTPRHGSARHLVDHVADGVARQMAGLAALGGTGTPSRERGLKELKDVLGLRAIPHRIEGYDISTTQGHEAVGSMVVFHDGVARPSEYRRFKIEQVTGQDDFAMLHEVLSRRLSRLCKPARQAGARTSWTTHPGLVLIDGGRGQLGAALAARAEYPDCVVPMVSLAKEQEEVYAEGRPEPVDLASDSPGSLILQAVRDEAHRFAVAYHRRLRDSSALTSILDDVSGVGPRRRRAVLLAYESLDALRAADASEIAQRCGIPESVAEGIKKRLAGA